MAYFTEPKDLIDIRRFAGYPLQASDDAFEAALAALDEDAGNIIKKQFLTVLRDRETKINAGFTLMHVTADDETEFNPEQMAMRRYELAVLAGSMCDTLGVAPGPALRASLRAAQGRNGKLVL